TRQLVAVQFEFESHFPFLTAEVHGPFPGARGIGLIIGSQSADRSRQDHHQCRRQKSFHEMPPEENRDLFALHLLQMVLMRRYVDAKAAKAANPSPVSPPNLDFEAGHCAQTRSFP